MTEALVSDFEHRRLQSLLPWWLNGTLDADEQRQVEQHLKVCASCRKECEFLAHCNEAFSDMDSPEPDFDAAFARKDTPAPDIDAALTRTEPAMHAAFARTDTPAPDVDAAFARVMQRIDRSGRQSMPRVSHRSESVPGIGDTGNRRAKLSRWWPVAAAAVLILGVLALMRPVADFFDADYSVLSSGPESSTSANLRLEVQYRTPNTANRGLDELRKHFADPGMVSGWEPIDELTVRFTLDDSVTPLMLSRVLDSLSVSESVTRAALVEP